MYNETEKSYNYYIINYYGFITIKKIWSNYEIKYLNNVIDKLLFFYNNYI